MDYNLSEMLIDPAVDMPVLRQLAMDLRDRRNSFAAFVGAGVSAQSGYPLWRDLIDRMGDQASSKSRDSSRIASLRSHPDLLWRAEEFRRLLGDAYPDFMSQQFGKKPVSECHRILRSLNFQHFITTNYDETIESAFEEVCESIKEPSWAQPHGKRFVIDTLLSSSDRRAVVHIHGKRSVQETLVLTSSDYTQAYVTDREHSDSLAMLLVALRVVFIGFSLEDADVKSILRNVNARYRRSDSRHYAILGESAKPHLGSERNRMDSLYGIKVVFYKDINKHQFLPLVLKYLQRAGCEWPGKASEVSPPTGPYPIGSPYWNHGHVSADGARGLLVIPEGQERSILLRRLAGPPLTGSVHFYWGDNLSQHATAACNDDEASVKFLADKSMPVRVFLPDESLTIDAMWDESRQQHY
jgi:NAD-dependent SIR2 family protein deacetylase